MKRSMMQVYVDGSDKAVEFYVKAFDAKIISSYKNDDGTYYHCELDIDGEILAVSEQSSMYAIKGETGTGNVMQFCLHYGEGNEDKVQKAYDVLSNNATIIIPLASCEYSVLMADFIDCFGVRWCIFV